MLHKLPHDVSERDCFIALVSIFQNVLKRICLRKYINDTVDLKLVDERVLYLLKLY